MKPLNLLPVAPERVAWGQHHVAEYHAGAAGPQLLLVHSINAAASAFEMRGPFRELQADHRVCAIDLLGYGNSDRPARRYVAEDYIGQLLFHLERLGRPATLIASSLGAAYAVAAAARRPELVAALVLVCPVGISQLAAPPGPGARRIHRLLRSPLGRLLFRLLTTRPGTRYFLSQQAYHDPARITPEVLAGFGETCRRPGAYYAPICFLSGMLNCTIGPSFAGLPMPIQLVWGRHATTTPLRKAAEFQAANPAARLAVIEESSLLAQDERPAEFAAVVREFLVKSAPRDV